MAPPARLLEATASLRCKIKTTELPIALAFKNDGFVCKCREIRNVGYMKNIQIIDGALNCTFSFFQATEEEFLLLFPASRQDIQYAEDLNDLPMQEEINLALQQVWQRPIRKQDVQGVHGTLFYQLQRYKDTYHEKREEAVDPSAINSAQRRLFGLL
jgi:hypothetical protein